MHKVYKKLTILLTALCVLFMMSGCEPQDNNGSGDTGTSTSTDLSGTDSGDDAAASADEDEQVGGTPLETQDNLNIGIGEDEEGAW